MARTETDGGGDRGEPSGLWVYLLLRLNRWVASAGVLAGVFVVLVAASQVGLAPLRQIAAAQDGMEFLFTAFIGAIITGTSIVVTINQLVLSQELGAVGDQRNRMDESMAFQRDVEAVIHEQLTPPEPAAFLWELIDGAHELSVQFADAVEASDDELQADVDTYVEDLVENAELVKDQMKDAQFGTFDVIWAALNFNYSRKIYDARELRRTYESSFDEAATESLDELIEALTLFGPAREHFKTLYFQWELIKLSKALLYISVPALAVMAVMIMYVDATAITGTTLGVDDLVWVTSAGFVVGIAPFVVFTTFIVRIATVAKRTLAMGPFILRESQRDADLD